MGSMGGRIALQLIEGLSGRLSVESGPGGTRVALDVPAGIGDDPPQLA